MRVQACKSAPRQTPISSPGCSLHFWVTGCERQVPATSCSDMINLLERLMERRETLIYTYWTHQFLIEGFMEDSEGRREEEVTWGKVCRSFCPSGPGVGHPPGTWRHSPAWQLNSHCSRVFNGAQYGALLPFQELGVCDGRFQTSNHLSLWGPAPSWGHLGALSHLISSAVLHRGSFWTTKDTAFTQEIPRALGALCHEPEDQIYSLL